MEEAAEGSRRPAGQSALPLLRGGRPGGGTGCPDRPGSGSGGWGPWHEELGSAGARAAAEAGLPGTWRASPRPGRGSGSAGGCEPSKARPGGRLRGLGPQEVGPRTPGSRLVLSTPVASSQGRPREGRISGAAAEAPGGRGGGGGRLARRLGERPGGPGLGPPQPSPLAAGGTRSGCDRRGRKLSDLRGKTSKQTAVRRRCPPASALAPLNPPQPNPATGYDLGRPLCGRAQGIGNPDATTGPPSLAAAASAYLASASRHSDSD